jgi:Flp pilus assembly protein TadG
MIGLALSTLLRRLRGDTSGVSIIEFGAAMPVLLVIGLYGIEMANLSIASLQVSQIAMSTADNASRLEQSSTSSVSPTVTETEVNSVLTGAVQEGKGISLSTKGKVIVSSLELNSSSKQYIHWQRCTGSLSATSAYGVEGAVVTGLGTTGKQVTAASGMAVMFVEVYYRQTGLFGSMFVKPMTLHQEAAFLIRDARNLTAGLSGTKTATC